MDQLQLKGCLPLSLPSRGQQRKRRKNTDSWLQDPPFRTVHLPLFLNLPPLSSLPLLVCVPTHSTDWLNVLRMTSNMVWASLPRSLQVTRANWIEASTIHTCQAHSRYHPPYSVRLTPEKFLAKTFPSPGRWNNWQNLSRNPLQVIDYH